MADESTNDNEATRATAVLRKPDAHGQAAFLLVESLLNGLIERSVLTVGDAIDIVETSDEIQQQIGAELGDPPAARRALTLLNSISSGLRAAR